MAATWDRVSTPSSAEHVQPCPAYSKKTQSMGQAPTSSHANKQVGEHTLDTMLTDFVAYEHAKKNQPVNNWKTNEKHHRLTHNRSQNSTHKSPPAKLIMSAILRSGADGQWMFEVQPQHCRQHELRQCGLSQGKGHALP